MGKNHRERLEDCFARAIHLFEQSLGIAPQSPVDLKIEPAEGFDVKVSSSGDLHSLLISKGVVSEIDRIWDLLWGTPVLTTGEGFEQPNLYGQKIIGFEDLADLSLTWLLLHEIMHSEMGHLAFAPEAHLVEVGLPAVEFERDIPAGLGQADFPLIDKCLEMQADSEATDVFLGPYDKNNWSDLRIQAVCIFLVMALIERENVRLGNQGLTHPRAGTRFITLFGHLFQMWLYPNATLDRSSGDTVIKTPKLPDAEEFHEYAHAVLTPLVSDASYVAGFCEAYSFLEEIGGKGALFRDIFTAQYGEELTDASFLTDAAKEWLLLRSVNEKMMVASGHRD